MNKETILKNINNEMHAMGSKETISEQDVWDALEDKYLRETLIGNLYHRNCPKVRNYIHDEESFNPFTKK